MKSQELPDCLELADDNEIRKCQKDFADVLKAAGEQHRQVTIGLHGGRDKIGMWWFKKHKFWWAYVKGSTRHWNVFGTTDNIDKPTTQGHHIVCEINPPIHADNWHPTGRFGKDDKGRYYIAHTGHFNASGKWIKLGNFVFWPSTQICDTDRSVLVVSALDDRKLIENVGKFVKIVQKVKEMSRMPYLPNPQQNLDDEQEQLELEPVENAKPKDEIIKELKNLGLQTPKVIKFKGKTYRRDNKTMAQLKVLRDYKCQICGITIRKKNGDFYIEAAHIKRKSEKGPETPDNILVLCPNHHKEFDHGDRKIIEHSGKKIIFKMNGKKHEISLRLQ